MSHQPTPPPICPFCVLGLPYGAALSEVEEQAAVLRRHARRVLREDVPDQRAEIEAQDRWVADLVARARRGESPCSTCGPDVGREAPPVAVLERKRGSGRRPASGVRLNSSVEPPGR
ncbi:MAG: hypothetical protein JNJ88_11315 [Planctomycetes bacterium]|nr:hypothetical protein [Planctomycetota bacterium]